MREQLEANRPRRADMGQRPPERFSAGLHFDEGRVGVAQDFVLPRGRRGHSRRGMAATEPIRDQLSFPESERQRKRSNQTACHVSDSRPRLSERWQRAAAMMGIIYELPSA